MSKTTPQDFEQSLQTLDTIINKMQAGNQPLEQALEHFEQGIKLIKTCQKALTEAEQRVQILTKNHQLEDFDHDHSE